MVWREISRIFCVSIYIFIREKNSGYFPPNLALIPLLTNLFFHKFLEPYINSIRGQKNVEKLIKSTPFLTYIQTKKNRGLLITLIDFLTVGKNCKTFYWANTALEIFLSSLWPLHPISKIRFSPPKNLLLEKFLFLWYNIYRKRKRKEVLIN